VQDPIDHLGDLDVLDCDAGQIRHRVMNRVKGKFIFL
jgi:hypothetical protein